MVKTSSHGPLSLSSAGNHWGVGRILLLRFQPKDVNQDGVARISYCFVVFLDSCLASVPYISSANKSFCLLNSHPNQPFQPPPQDLLPHSPFVIPEGSKLEGFLPGFPCLFDPPNQVFPSLLLSRPLSLFPLCPSPVTTTSAVPPMLSSCKQLDIFLRTLLCLDCSLN